MKMYNMTSKTQNMGEQSKQCSSFSICLNLNDYQYKTSRYSYRSTHMNLMVTSNQKPTTDTQKLKRNEHKHTTKENHQTTREETKKKITEKNYENNWKTCSKMV